MEIVMKDICKSFGSVQVLKNARIDLRGGEVHALMGENGAGKSTLMKILTGLYQKDSGEVIVDGVPVNYSSPSEAEKNGIVFIHQELNVMQDLSVEANMFMGKEILKKFGFVDKKAMVKKSSAALKKLGFDVSPNTKMSDLSVGQQQMIEIAKALLINAKVIIMDEPTSALSPSETIMLFKVIDDLKKEGVSFIYISHRMEEIFELCDRVTVLRDGEFVDTKEIKDIDTKDIVRMMIGRELTDYFPERTAVVGDVALELKGLSNGKNFNDINFSVRYGEVLGIAGLMGAGRTEIMHALYGNIPVTGGEILLDGKVVDISSPSKAIENKIGFITEDRKNEGLLLETSIKSNLTIANLESNSNKGFINPIKEREFAINAIDNLRIRSSSEDQHVLNLSGGNQQKVVFAKWVYKDLKVLILDEPTRGVDVGAKREIYSVINQLAKDGVAIIFISSELPEVLGMSDRIMAIHEGKVSGFVDKEFATEENVMTLCTGGEINVN